MSPNSNMTNGGALTFVERFLKLESSGGILLVLAAVIANVMTNTDLDKWYQLLIDTPVEIRIGAFDIDKPLLLWVNDGLMAVFFLMVGLELKREFMEGELSEPSMVLLPGLGAIGGMAVPALVYSYLNWDNPVAMNGWAIPAATDIAFALGVLSLLGSRVPIALKVFLTSLAIFDDIGAILIIAFFYTSKISMAALIIAFGCVLVLWRMNRMGVSEKSLYLIVGLVMWIAMLKSGVHATLAGIIIALFIPMRSERGEDKAPAKTLERDLHASVVYFILPFFAFCNAGINFEGIGVEQLLHPVSLGIALGLFFGKQVGVFFFCWLGIRLKWTEMPPGMSWLSLYGTAALCGIGFTMSLFIGSLAFQESGVNQVVDERLGIIIGSLLSGVVGYFLLNFALKKSTN